MWAQVSISSEKFGLAETQVWGAITQLNGGQLMEGLERQGKAGT